jgi:hypothetical protein
LSSGGALVGNPIVAIDPDTEQRLQYSLLSSPNASNFEIDSSSGQVSVSNTAVGTNKLKAFIGTGTYAVYVQVQDSGVNTLQTVKSVDIRVFEDNLPPVFDSNLLSFAVDENSNSKTNVGSPVVANDPENTAVTYSVEGESFYFTKSGTSGTHNLNNFVFNIDPRSGQIYVRQDHVLDTEHIANFTLIIQARDSGLGQLTSQILVEIAVDDVNEAPQIDKLNSALYVAENSDIGSPVGTPIGASDQKAVTSCYIASRLNRILGHSK